MQPAPVPTSGGNELFVRVARKEGKSVAVMRAVDYGTQCIVETEVFPPNAVTALRPGPYTFPDSREATAFVTEAVEALMYLGCDVQAA
jgi:hypothetical protein